MNHKILSLCAGIRWILGGLLAFVLLMGVLFTGLLYQDLVTIINLPFLSRGEQVVAVMSLYGSPLTHVNILTLVGMTTVSLLGAVNMLLILNLRLRKRGVIRRHLISKEHLWATVLVVAGMGCAACGSVVLLSLLSVIGLGVSVWFTHWISAFVLVLAIGVLGYANIKLYQQQCDGMVCQQ